MIVRDGVVVEDGLNALQVGKKFDMETMIENLTENKENFYGIDQTFLKIIYEKFKNDQKIKELDFYKVLSAVYSPTGAPAYVLDSVIDSFNESVAKYVELVWPSASYALNSYKETSKGDVVASLIYIPGFYYRLLLVYTIHLIVFCNSLNVSYNITSHTL